MHKTRHLKITYGGPAKPVSARCDPPLPAEHSLHVWSDASWGEEIKSHGGHAVMYRNAAICWTSRKIKVKALSSAEAEIVAGVVACKDTIFVRGILQFMWIEIGKPTPLIIDSEAMWNNTRNIGVSQLNRHFAEWQLFVRDCYLKLIVSVHKTGTNDEVADILTKAMPKAEENFKRFRSTLMNSEVQFS